MIVEMRVADVYIKVQLILAERDDVLKIAGEICRKVEDVYEVRSAELSSVVERE